MKTIEIIVKTDGTLSIEAVGFQGKSCEKATQALEKALGTTEQRKKKPEYYQRAALNQNRNVEL
ncbi:DUF2997 domain-containing protein [Paenibacillus sp. UNC451MF]|uniref:DUF2997 domain-containing protein n=1 Tax=Paenibacillus sp. UNC451MF TaxID=1449063 RepID=UPI00048E045A|nr:DUF2997 domain-containing protein [Paenibacillus sp. UNC451MF]